MAFGSLSNHTFNVVGIGRNTPWIYACAIANGGQRTEKCTLPGLSVEAMTLLSKTLGFNYTVLWVQTYAELEHMIANGTADFSLSFVGATPELWEKYIFMPPLNFLELGFLGRLPSKIVTGLPLFRPFTYHTWLCLALVFALVASILSLQRFSLRSWPDSAFRLTSFMLSQGDLIIVWREGKIKPQISFNILMTLFAIFLVIIQSLFSSVTLSFLYPGRPVIPYRDTESLARLVESGERNIYTASNRTFYFNWIRDSKSPGHLRMWDAIRKNPLKYYTDSDDMRVGLTLREDRTLITPMTSLSYGTQIRYAGKVVKFVRDESLVGTWESIMMRKDFPYVDLFKQIIAEVGLQHVLVQIAERDYYHVSETDLAKDRAGSLRPAQLQYLAPMFHIWFGGLAIATAVFVIELLRDKVFRLRLQMRISASRVHQRERPLS